MKRPALSSPPKVGIVGAGIAGPTCARVLTDHGLDVTLFDKGRAPGGRTSRRRAEPFQFDHGAQYFTARDPVFRRHVESWRKDGVIDRWQGQIVSIGLNGIEDVTEPDERFVGVPGMNALAKHLATDLEVRTGVEISGLQQDGGQWRFRTKTAVESEAFDVIALAVPATQALSLLGDLPTLAEPLEGIGMSPCWAALLGFDERLDLPFDAASASDSPIGWLSRNNSKPGRDGAESWVLHARHDWSEAHLEDDADPVLRNLVDAFGTLTGLSVTPAYEKAHRWRYALAHRPLGDACLFDEDQRIGVCGDWCLAGRLEAAFQSGAALAGRILSRESR
jgi:predicted NAD/FAD-dependent oxidoreductase